MTLGILGISLGFLWDFLKPILSDAMKDRLKPRGSAETAKRRAFHLYETLVEINQRTDDFVTALQSLTESIERREISGLIIKQNNLKFSADALMLALPKLVEALHGINPQLEIHQPKLAQKFSVYIEAAEARKVTTREALTALGECVNEIFYTETKTLKQLVTQADENRNLIRKAIEDFRGFLVKEFSFKESF